MEKRKVKSRVTSTDCNKLNKNDDLHWRLVTKLQKINLLKRMFNNIQFPSLYLYVFSITCPVNLNTFVSFSMLFKKDFTFPSRNDCLRRIAIFCSNENSSNKKKVNISLLNFDRLNWLSIHSYCKIRIMTEFYMISILLLFGLTM